MSFIRKIKRGDKIYLAEVENKWVDGRCVQKHLRYIGTQKDDKFLIASSISNIEVTEVKVFGPLLVLDTLAKKIDLESLLGSYGKEILAMVYAHCLDYKSLNKMPKWFERSDLPFILSLEKVTRDRLDAALDSIELLQARNIQQTIFEAIIKQFKVEVSGIVYDVTNTYLYGSQCPLGKRGHSKDGHPEHPLIQIGMAVTKNEGFPICHKVLDGNIHDTRMFRDFITDIRRYNVKDGIVVYDRGISSARNLIETKDLGLDTLCGLPIKGALGMTVRKVYNKKEFVALKNRVKLRKNVFYVRTVPHEIDGLSGTLAVCFNPAQKQLLQESRYDEIQYAKEQRAKHKSIKPGLERFLDKQGDIDTAEVAKAEEFDGISCLFSTLSMSKEEFVKMYFDKNIIERSFRTIKGTVTLQPVRHWLADKVTAHVFVCYLSYVLLSLLEYHLRHIPMSADEALDELASMYKVYLRDSKLDYRLSRTVALSKKQELILKGVDKKLLKS